MGAHFVSQIKTDKLTLSPAVCQGIATWDNLTSRKQTSKCISSAVSQVTSHGSHEGVVIVLKTTQNSSEMTAVRSIALAARCPDILAVSCARETAMSPQL